MTVIDQCRQAFEGLGRPAQLCIAVCVAATVLMALSAIFRPARYGQTNSHVSERLRHLVRSAEAVETDPKLATMGKQARALRLQQASAWLQAASTLAPQRSALDQLSGVDTAALELRMRHKITEAPEEPVIAPAAPVIAAAVNRQPVDGAAPVT